MNKRRMGGNEILGGFVLSVLSIAGTLAAASWRAKLKREEDTPRFTYAGLKLLLEQREKENARLRKVVRALERRVQVAQEAYHADCGRFVTFEDDEEWDEIDRMH